MCCGARRRTAGGRSNSPVITRSCSRCSSRRCWRSSEADAAPAARALNGATAHQMPPIITLTTDFGTSDAFVGVMKGVILGIAPDARIVDLTHEVPPQDVLAGAYLLRGAAPYFPRGTIHVAVVDPGVGTKRRALVVAARFASQCAWRLPRSPAFRYD